ncbi:probable E3 ubiquitin-protein ligase TRIML1 [Antechinus flavipes]|uniref:probable E3 ubiquitin-protein ligase TRIML1 n=1 Tax=Antechinus flavipes TaxID=38775 RepID=UPI0022361F3E|nr:probable E3 ubiquitin-protein ligase TRIML1 [Antechinus flavipes]
MAAANLAEDLKEELTCAVCLEYFSHPVTLGCGHSFCHLCLLRSWEGAEEPSSCPECRRAFWMREVQPNHRLRKLVSIARNLRPYLLQIREERIMCEKHKEEQNLFCEEDQSFLCASCFQSQEHSNHLVQPLNRAAQASRRQTNAWRESVRAEYGRLLDFLKLQEKRHLIKLAWEEKQNLQKFIESENRLSQHLQNLKEEIIKIEQICQIPNLQFLQVAGDTSRRIQTLLSKRPETARNKLARIHITGIFEMMNTFRVNVTLDPESASPYLIVSNDLKTVRNGGCLQNIPMTPDRFEDEIILGAQVFTSGVHYWEVDVGNTLWVEGSESHLEIVSVVYVKDKYLSSDRGFECQILGAMKHCSLFEMCYGACSPPQLVGQAQEISWDAALTPEASLLGLRLRSAEWAGHR